MLTTASPSHGGHERGVALPAAIALLVLASFVIVAIMVASRASSDRARERLEGGASTQLVRDASSAISTGYSAMASGEFDGFIPSQSVLQFHAARLDGASVVSNASLPTVLGDPTTRLGQVDSSRVPPSGRFTMREPLDGGRTGFWQVYSAKLPTWGTTRGGRVVVYVRTWTTGSAGVITKPLIHRLEFRPSWFADYQMLTDGPILFNGAANIAGRVHSNGYSASYYDQYRSMTAAGTTIKFLPGPGTCTSTSRITVATGTVVGKPSCVAVSRTTPGVRYNLLRARSVATRLREICAQPAASHPGLVMSCSTATTTTNVRLTATGISINGGPEMSAVTVGDRPGQQQGAIFVASGDVVITGRLGPNARALVVAAAPASSSYGSGGAPSAWIRSGGDVGADAVARSSSFGLVVEGDVILDETVACGVRLRGAFLTMSGLISSHPTWRVPYDIPGAPFCNGEAHILGSIASHYSPFLIKNGPPGIRAGFATRRYEWMPGLYDNPPPMYPTAADWQQTSMETADLDCFTTAGTLIPSEVC